MLYDTIVVAIEQGQDIMDSIEDVDYLDGSLKDPHFRSTYDMSVRHVFRTLSGVECPGRGIAPV